MRCSTILGCVTAHSLTHRSSNYFPSCRCKRRRWFGSSVVYSACLFNQSFSYIEIILSRASRSLKRSLSAIMCCNCVLVWIATSLKCAIDFNRVMHPCVQLPKYGFAPFPQKICTLVKRDCPLAQHFLSGQRQIHLGYLFEFIQKKTYLSKRLNINDPTWISFITHLFLMLHAYKNWYFP